MFGWGGIIRTDPHKVIQWWEPPQKSTPLLGKRDPYHIFSYPKPNIFFRIHFRSGIIGNSMGSKGSQISRALWKKIIEIMSRHSIFLVETATALYIFRRRAEQTLKAPWQEWFGIPNATGHPLQALTVKHQTDLRQGLSNMNWSSMTCYFQPMSMKKSYCVPSFLKAGLASKGSYQERTIFAKHVWWVLATPNSTKESIDQKPLNKHLLRWKWVTEGKLGLWVMMWNLTDWYILDYKLV